jgi:hypothetical protein
MNSKMRHSLYTGEKEIFGERFGSTNHIEAQKIGEKAGQYCYDQRTDFILLHNIHLTKAFLSNSTLRNCKALMEQ